MDKKECKLKPNYVVEPDIENKLVIKCSENGYFVEYYEQLLTEEDEPITYRKKYFTFDEELDRFEIDEGVEREITDEEKAMSKLLNFIKNHFEVRYNKHKPVNLIVEFEDLRKEFAGEDTEEQSQETEPELSLHPDKKKELERLANDLCNTAVNGMVYVGMDKYGHKEETEVKKLVMNSYDKLHSFIDKL